MKRPATLRRAMSGAVTQAVVIIGSVALGFGATAVITSDDVPMRQLPTIEQSTGSPADLIAEHDCWTGAAPADMEGVMPGAVVVTRDGRTIYGGPRLVEQALDQVFNGVDHDLTVHAFCRGGDLR